MKAEIACVPASSSTISLVLFPRGPFARMQRLECLYYSHENRNLQRQFSPQTFTDRARLVGPSEARCALSSRNQSPGQRVSAAGISGIRIRDYLPGDEVVQRCCDIESGEAGGGGVWV